MMWFHPVDKNLLFTKNDALDPRLGECVTALGKFNIEDLSQQTGDFYILGYADDEGIRLNGGRPGAQSAPREIRTSLYKMTPHLHSLRSPRIVDLGDLSNHERPLPERHEYARNIVHTLARQNQTWLSFGGGHDYGYCDSAAFVSAFPNNSVVINFDAHLDVRPTEHGFNSGTPFFRLLTEFKNQVHFAEVGLQNQCNSKSHFKWAQEQGAHLVTLDEVQSIGLTKVLTNLLKGHETKKIFLSVDIDAFCSMEAPGCSQSWTTGLRTADFLNTLTYLIKNHDVRGMGIYEVSPPLDVDNRTSKLAALLAHHFIFAKLEKK